ncbi:MAG: ADP-ribosylglycohydrolase family protein [Thermoguttaceae bacterium]|nr:ADP-ribosylglycohydrolase family protein [Thermoguttaceae bacterium]
MIGAIIGDSIGAIYEFSPIKRTDFEAWTPDSRFTDDSVMTVATADAILNGGDYGASYRRWGRLFPNASFWPNAGYGGSFVRWLATDDAPPYDSFGNGSAMRVGPVGRAFATLEETLAEAEKSAACSHNHPEGIKGAQATAAAIFWARNGESKDFIRASVEKMFGYDLSKNCDEIRPGYRFSEICQTTVPQALAAFFDASNFEEAIRLAVSLGGDADTLACITGSVAEAFWGADSVPNDWRQKALERLDERMKAVVEAFEAKFPA